MISFKSLKVKNYYVFCVYYNQILNTADVQMNPFPLDPKGQVVAMDSRLVQSTPEIKRFRLDYKTDVSSNIFLIIIVICIVNFIEQNNTLVCLKPVKTSQLI